MVTIVTYYYTIIVIALEGNFIAIHFNDLL